MFAFNCFNCLRFVWGVYHDASGVPNDILKCKHGVHLGFQSFQYVIQACSDIESKQHFICGVTLKGYKHWEYLGILPIFAFCTTYSCYVRLDLCQHAFKTPIRRPVQLTK